MAYLFKIATEVGQLRFGGAEVGYERDGSRWVDG
jgi:hypothetical protein